uniref:Uncharacterized protein n=1 Tax=Anguilla anguilla TaxID=7936 RepID=A0A0E9SX03_ANGAN
MATASRLCRGNLHHDLAPGVLTRLRAQESEPIFSCKSGIPGTEGANCTA